MRKSGFIPMLEDIPASAPKELKPPPKKHTDPTQRHSQPLLIAVTELKKKPSGDIKIVALKDQKPGQPAGDKNKRISVDESLLVHEMSKISNSQVDKAGQDSDEDFDANVMIDSRILKGEDGSLNSSVAEENDLTQSKR